MVLDPTPLNNTSGPRTLSIPAREIIPQVQPAISIGEVLRLSVRSNNNGEGQLYFRGLLISAKLPPDLESGDKIYAQVTEADNQLILRILQTNPSELPELSAAQPQLSASAQNLVASQLGDLVRETLVQLTELRNAAQAAATADAQPLVAAEQSFAKAADVLAAAFDRLTANLATSESLTDAGSAQAQLMQNVTGKAVITLRNAATELRQIANGNLPVRGQQFIVDLESELQSFLEEGVKNNILSKKHLESLIAGTQQELRASRQPAIRERDALTATLRDLETAKEQPEKGLSKLQQAANRLAEVVAGTQLKLDRLDPKAKSDLEQIASRLEQLANTQETLNQLNPMMQALGEPALILFPFLAHGLLNHSELSFESSLDRKSLGGGIDDDEDSFDNTPFQRIQISVPLPEIGTVHVDVAHRNEEMLVRFTIADSEASDFIKNRLDELSAILRKHQFTKLDLNTHIGPPESTVLPLPDVFHMPKTIVA
ncbi:MAG: hypothetical protein U0136_01845 [Bdellovibrionota bacterium]